MKIILDLKTSALRFYSTRENILTNMKQHKVVPNNYKSFMLRYPQ